MPIISITLLPGYSNDAQARLVGRVAKAARSVVASPAAGTTVYVQHAQTYQRDGAVLSGGAPARADAAQLVRRFLDHMQERDLPAAKALLAPGFTMRFPGSPEMHQLEQLVEFSRGRYRNVVKTYAGVDESWTDDGATVVCFGTLHGQWMDGTPFEGIRFLDRFEVTNNLISRQDVWNDLALHMPGPVNVG